MNCLKYIVFLLAISLLNHSAFAEIYKYKDAKGHWQFSNKEIKGENNTRVNTHRRSSGKVAASRNFDALLNKKYRSKNPVEKATLAVVTVKSTLGTGSGFFVTADCYVVTNKHVIRPAAGKNWNKTQAKIKRSDAELQASKRNLADEQQRLKLNKEKLDEFKEYVEGASSGSRKTREQAKYQLYLNRHNRDKEKFESIKKRFAEQEQKFMRQKSDFNFSGSVANTAQSFEIILKDNTKTRANLIKISANEDLALLKVNQCKAPYLLLTDSRTVSQGMDIYAVGSPLGLRDQLTKGTVTQVTYEGIATDAQILPGNSGGPLISDKGEVVGVNTLKVSKNSVMDKGFGIAIPAAKVKQNFGGYLQ